MLNPGLGLGASDILARGLEYDAVILSGGTSKGAGDLSYEVVGGLSDPGVKAGLAELGFGVQQA
jgi:hypothetical protein